MAAEGPRVGRRTEEFTAVELSDDEKPPLITQLWDAFAGLGPLEGKRHR
jgi:hypothetical protein